jgi:hypothetical protein
MSKLAPLLLFLLLPACGGAPESCPEGQLLRKGLCEDYIPGEPVKADTWRPEPGTSWQIQYTGALDASPEVEMFDLDLFDASDAFLDDLHAEGRVIVCYFSAGSYEDWRPDAGEFPGEALGEPLEGWAGEWWLDIRDPEVRRILEARLDLAAERGCDGVDPDNVNGFENPTGFALTATEQLEFNRFLADEAHARGLAIGLKNDLSQIPELLEWFDWELNEECVAWDECALLAPFTASGRAAFHVEYVDDWGDAVAKAAEVCGVGPSLDTLVKTWDLGAEFLPCP